MRKKEIIKGLKNSTRFRVVLDGLGLYMSISDTEKAFATSSHRVATQVALQKIADAKINGIGTSIKVYDHKLQSKVIQVQVDLL